MSRSLWKQKRLLNMTTVIILSVYVQLCMYNHFSSIEVPLTCCWREYLIWSSPTINDLSSRFCLKGKWWPACTATTSVFSYKDDHLYWIKPTECHSIYVLWHVNKITRELHTSYSLKRLYKVHTQICYILRPKGPTGNTWLNSTRPCNKWF